MEQFVLEQGCAVDAEIVDAELEVGLAVADPDEAGTAAATQRPATPLPMPPLCPGNHAGASTNQIVFWRMSLAPTPASRQ